MSVGQGIGAAVGGVVAAVYGGPAGANLFATLQGAAYGAAIGGFLDPPPGPDLQGLKIDDASAQTSEYGAPINRGNGKFPAVGSVVWVEGGERKIVPVKTDNEGGKGGDAGTTKNDEAFWTGAIILADHPVDGIGRLWFGPNLVSNSLTEDLATAAASGEIFPTLSLQADTGLLKASLNTNPTGGTVRLYPGMDDQPVDPRYEADRGAGRASAWRGYTVLFVYDMPLKDYGNSIPGMEVKAELIVGDGSADPVLLHEEERDRPGAAIYINAPHLSNGTAYVYAVEHTTDPVDGWSYAMGLETQPFLLSSENDGPGAFVPRAAEGWADVEGFPPDARPLTTAQIDLLRGGITFNCFSSFGRYYLKDGTYYYFDLVSPWKIYVGLNSVVYGSDIALIAVDDSGNIYAVSETLVKKYDSDLNLLSSMAVSFGTDIFGNASRVMFDDSTGLLWVQTRTVAAPNDHYHPILFEEGYQADPVVVPIGDFSGAYASLNFSIRGNLLTRFRYIAGSTLSGNVQSWRLPTPNGGGQSLAAVVRERMEASSLIEPSDIDVTLLTDTVRGFKTAGLKPIRTAIETLMAGYHFDVVDSGYQLRCVARGQSSVMTIDYEDLDCRPAGSAPSPALSTTFEMAKQLPKRVDIGFLDADRNYNKNVQPSIERLASQAVSIESYDLAIVFTVDEAAQLANHEIDRKWTERQRFNTFTLPQTYQALESADVITIPAPEATYEIKLTEVNHLADGRVQCQGVVNDAAIHVQNAVGGQGVLGDTVVKYAGASIMHLLDIPLIRDEDDKPGFAGALSGKTSSWPGGSITRSVDSGQTWKSVQSFRGPVTAGICRGSLPVNDGAVIDRVNTLTVDFYSSDMLISSITQEQMLTGMNWAAYGVPGRMELIQFANATLNADGSYTLDTFVRGAKGTEQYTGTHVDGDVFVFLSDADAAFIAANISDIGAERLYKGLTSGKNIDSVQETAFTYLGVNKKPLSPVQLDGSIDGSDNWDLTWLRRSRLSSSWWTNGVEAPIGEDSESYEIDIMNGATVVRTLTSTTPAVQYTSANQVTDWGSNQTTLTLRVYQMSAIVGRGYVAEITL